MADLGSIFSGFGTGFLQAENELLGQRQKTAEMFMRYQQQNPTASFQQYQDFLNQVSPDRFLRGPGYSDEVLRQMSDEGARKLANQKEKDRLGVIQEQLKTQETYSSFVDNTLKRALDQSGENDSPDDVRMRTKKILESSGVQVDNNISQAIDNIDYTGRLREHRLNKLKKEQEDVSAAVNIYSGSELPPEAIEAELTGRGFSAGVAGAARKRIENERNDKRASLLNGLQDSLDKNPSVDGLLLDETKSIGDFVDDEAKKKAITLTWAERDAIKANLELRRKQAMEKRDSAEVEQTTKAKAVADSLTNLETEDEVRQTLNAQSMSQGMKDAILGQWRSGRNAVYTDRMKQLREQLNPSKNPTVAGYVADEKPDAIKLMITNFARENKISLPEDSVNSLVSEFMQGKLAIARDSLDKDMQQNIKLLQDRMTTQTQTNVKTFDELQQTKTDSKDKRVMAIAKSVAARNVDATVGQIEDSVRAAIAKAGSNVTDGDIVDTVTSALPNAQSQIVKEQQLYKNPIDQKKAVAQLYAGIGRINEGTYQLEDAATRYAAGDVSALRGLKPDDYKNRIVPGIIADIDSQIAQIQQMLRMKNSSQLNLTPEGEEKFQGFVQGLTQLRQRITQSAKSFDIKDPGAQARLEADRIRAEQNGGTATPFTPSTPYSPAPRADASGSAFSQDVSNTFSSISRTNEVKNQINQIAQSYQMQAAPAGYFFNSAQKREEASVVADFSRNPNTIQFFSQYPQELELFRRDPVGYAKARMGDIKK
ncbi:hypothetical protein UFOVP235_31 [uncultured Caudovirales phage]|uniref:Uncharacterized protein n=1 Tax=uncultured Caudovirales phage TaxID=2100421 RepID=A0A6J7WRD0_9CAUD|nr:hypothetical protein UFOVP235_31 [uncultured Caudovirales phage]